MQVPWNDLALFAAVARAGSLAGAAGETGASQATLSRRMTALERTLARALFRRGGAGYALTAEGRELLVHAQRMERAASGAVAWAATQSAAAVRVTAGTWTAMHLAAGLPRFWSAASGWRPDFVACNSDMDIARREVDIGVRNRRPEQPWLAGRRTKVVRYLVCASDEGVIDWIGPSRDAVATRSAGWVERHHGRRIASRVNDPRLALDLARAGIGRVLLPAFTRRDGLVVLGEVEELAHEEWLVSHHEARHDPPVRAALDAIGRFLSAPDEADRLVSDQPGSDQSGKASGKK